MKHAGRDARMFRLTRPENLMAKNVKVRFTRDYQVSDEEARIFHEGKTYMLPEDSANHFIRRGAAEAVDGKSNEPATDSGTGK